jgi:hypothetical protein
VFKCFFHLKKNLGKKIRELELKKHEEEIMEDVRLIAELSDSNKFDLLSKLFIAKLRSYSHLVSEKSPETFADYFEKQYLDETRATGMWAPLNQVWVIRITHREFL